MEFSLARGARHNVLQITDSRRGLTIGLELKTCVVESCSAWAKSLRALEAELGAFLSWEQLLSSSLRCKRLQESWLELWGHCSNASKDDPFAG